MMTFRNFGEYVSAEPFQPFRIKMASGQVYEIRHPEMLLVGRSSVRVYTTAGSDPDKPPRWHDISMMLMETLEPFEVTSASGKN